MLSLDYGNYGNVISSKPYRIMSPYKKSFFSTKHHLFQLTCSFSYQTLRKLYTMILFKKILNAFFIITKDQFVICLYQKFLDFVLDRIFSQLHLQHIFPAILAKDLAIRLTRGWSAWIHILATCKMCSLKDESYQRYAHYLDTWMGALSIACFHCTVISVFSSPRPCLQKMIISPLTSRSRFKLQCSVGNFKTLKWFF